MNYEAHFLVALAITLVVESAGLWLLFRFGWSSIYKKTGFNSVISAGVIASALTLPYLWFVLPAFIGRPLFLVIGEVLIFFCEGLIYKRVLPLGYKQAFLASFVLNGASILAGKFLLPLFG